MKNLFVRFLTVLTFAVIPYTGFAAMTYFPVSREDILQHVLENTDYVQIGVWIRKSGDAFNPLGGGFFSSHVHLKEDGTVESINALARRSVEEFERFLVKKMRDAFNVSVDRSDTSLAGATFEIDYTLWKDLSSFHPWLPSTMISAEVFEKPLTLDSNGKIAIPEALFTVDLRAQVGNGSAAPFFVSGILSGVLTAENEDGTVSDTVNLFVLSDEDMLSIPTFYLNEYRRGKLTLRYRGGTEQTFNRLDGKLIETVLPDLRPITGIQVLYDNVLLTVKAKPEDDLRIDFASVLGRWEEQPNPTLTKSAADERLYSLPKRGPIGFFQVRSVPSAIKIR